MRTDSKGAVYVVWSGFDKQSGSGVFYQVRSTNGGQTFSRPQIITRVGGIGQFDAVQGRFTIDGVAGARTDVFPTIDIANGAPTGADATDRIVVTWSDDSAGTNDERAYVITSTDGGASYSSKQAATGPGRANQPAIAIAPDGSAAYLVYNAFTAPWQTTTEAPRPMYGVVLTAPITGGTIGAWTVAHTGASGDARGSSANGLTAEFLGDYNYAVATRTSGTAVWNDVRQAASCDLIDAYRQAILEAVQGGAEPIRAESPKTRDLAAIIPPTAEGSRPAPNSECPQNEDSAFGNTDIYSAVVTP